MKSCLLLCLALSALLYECNGQALPQVRCRIDWREVTQRSFMVRWDDFGACESYRLEFYLGYSDRTSEIIEGLFVDFHEIEDLNPYTAYGARVICVDRRGNTGPRGTACRTRTFRGEATTTTTPVPTAPTPVGACGVGRFTCENSQCIDGSLWCNGIFDCQDTTDERNCPGHCFEITQEDFHPLGNFSCSRWNSRRSACFFQCPENWSRRGNFYTVCVLGEWSQDFPTCVVDPPPFFVSGETRTTLTLDIDRLSNTTSWFVEYILDSDGVDVVDEITFNVVTLIDDDAVVQGTISGLQPGNEYELAIVAVDIYGVPGLPSEPDFGFTNP